MRRKWMAVLIISVMLLSLIQVPTQLDIVTAQPVLSNPRIVEDDSMISGRNVTWDCITFGSYPQREILPEDEVYSQLQALEDWDEHQEVVYEGTRYRRMKKSDATFTGWNNSGVYYVWEDDTTYHYFIYEPICWRVLKVEDGQALLLSDKVLDNPVLDRITSNLKWENSLFRSWLNGYDATENKDEKDYSDTNFIDFAFTQSEQEHIVARTREEIDNAPEGSALKDDPTDKLFFLSDEEMSMTDEAASYGFVKDKKVCDEAKMGQPTDYAKAMGCFVGNGTTYENTALWRLRYWTALYFYQFGYVSDGGTVENKVDWLNNNIGTRVALRLDVSDDSVYTYVGTTDSKSLTKAVEPVGEKGDTISNPRIEMDKTSNVMRKSTWDCVWFGSFPQREVTKTDSMYEELSGATTWDEQDEIILKGFHYKRLPDGDTSYRYYQYSPIKWRVLQVDGEQALLLSDQVLDYRAFHESGSDNCIWQYSAVRSWFNGYNGNYNWSKIDYTTDNFLTDAFAEKEQDAIVQATLDNSGGLFDGRKGKDIGKDKIFLLADRDVYGMDHARTMGFGGGYALKDEARRAIPSEYANFRKNDGTDTVTWMLRTSAPNNGEVTLVKTDGAMNLYGVGVKKKHGIRPALYLDLTKTDAYSYAGEVSTSGDCVEHEPITEATTETTTQVTESTTEIPTEVTEVTETTTEVTETTTEVTEATTEVTEATTEVTEATTETTEATTETTEEPSDISMEDVIVEKIENMVYTSKKTKPQVSLTYKGEKLVQGEDYSVEYKNSKQAGTGTAILTGMGNYTGEKQVSYRILPYDMSGLSKTLKGADGKIYRAVYTGKKIKVKTLFKIATQSEEKKVYLEPKLYKDYVVSYKNNKDVGEASIIFKFKGNYKGTLIKKFRIVPPAVSLSSLKNEKKGIVLSWSKGKACDRYEIYRKTKGKLYKKIATVKGKSKTTYTDKSVKKGKRYYYKVVAAKNVKGKTYRSSDSNSKKVTR